MRPGGLPEGGFLALPGSPVGPPPHSEPRSQGPQPLAPLPPCHRQASGSDSPAPSPAPPAPLPLPFSPHPLLKRKFRGTKTTVVSWFWGELGSPAGPAHVSGPTAGGRAAGGSAARCPLRLGPLVAGRRGPSSRPSPALRVTSWDVEGTSRSGRLGRVRLRGRVLGPRLRGKTGQNRAVWAPHAPFPITSLQLPLPHPRQPGRCGGRVVRARTVCLPPAAAECNLKLPRSPPRANKKKHLKWI